MISLVLAAVKTYPKRKLRLRVAGTDARISIHYRDILSETGHIAIASSNFFNTDLDIIAPKSVLSQFIVKCLNSQTNALDASISQSLAGVSATNVAVTRGKPLSYPVGTVACFDVPGGKKGFLMAITRVNYNGGQETVESQLPFIQTAIRELWQKVKTEINDEPLNITPLGSGVSRVFHKTMDSVMLLASEFVKECKRQRPCSELRIFIGEKDLRMADAVYLRELLSAIVS
jgi:hypothetical protein